MEAREESGPPSAWAAPGADARASAEVMLPNIAALAGAAGLPAGGLHVACKTRGPVRGLLTCIAVGQTLPREPACVAHHRGLVRRTDLQFQIIQAAAAILTVANEGPFPVTADRACEQTEQKYDQQTLQMHCKARIGRSTTALSALFVCFIWLSTGLETGKVLLTLAVHWHAERIY